MTFKRKIAAVIILSGISAPSSAYAEYHDWLAKERETANNVLDLQIIFQFVGITIEATNGANGKIQKDAVREADDVPDSSDNLKSASQVKKEYNNALDDVNEQLGRHWKQ